MKISASESGKSGKLNTAHTCTSQYGSIKVSVGTLVRLLYRSGDIHFRYDSSTLPEEGRRAQKQAQKSLLANPAYRKEVSLKYSWQNSGIAIHLQGRADGVLMDLGNSQVEEYKTTRTNVEALHTHTGEMHTAQLKLYAAILASQNPKHADWNLALVYIHPDTLEEVRFCETSSAEQLGLFLKQTCEKFAGLIVSHRQFLRKRNDSLRAVVFPYPEYRSNQKLLCGNVYRNLRDKKHTLLEAPTGSGKTLATIFPALKTIGHGHLDRMVFLTARNTGKNAVEHTTQLLTESGANVRSICLTAKNRICFQETVNCDPAICKYARGYYSRVAEAIDACLEHKQIRQATIEQVAAEFEVCPFELSLDVSVWCDVIVCDYNYVFDPFVRFQRLGGIFGERTALLIDESHQLVDRVRGCLSAQFSSTQVSLARKSLQVDSVQNKRLSGLVNSLAGQLTRLRSHARQCCEESMKQEGELNIEVPSGLLKTASSLVEYVSKESKLTNGFDPDVLELFFSCLELIRKFDFFSEDSHAFILQWDTYAIYLNLFCANPATHIAENIRLFPASLRFSGTLSPIGLYEGLHGVLDSVMWRVESSFASEQLGVFVRADIATQYKYRQSSLNQVVSTIRTVVGARAGNYMVAFPSYEYLKMVHGVFVQEHPHIDVITQTTGMDIDAQNEFLHKFTRKPGAMVGFVILGGFFTESIDFAVDELLGMVVVGISLPPPNLHTLTIAKSYTTSLQNTSTQNDAYGRLIAFRHPAMSRVIQAAGRLVRSHEDRGVLCLIDPRFRKSEYRGLFPDNWCSCTVNSLELPIELERFWATTDYSHGCITG